MEFLSILQQKWANSSMNTDKSRLIAFEKRSTERHLITNIGMKLKNLELKKIYKRIETIKRKILTNNAKRLMNQVHNADIILDSDNLITHSWFSKNR